MCLDPLNICLIYSFYGFRKAEGRKNVQKKHPVGPVIKWVGGKRQILDKILSCTPHKKSPYYEPFVGGGAVFFALKPKKAVINDINRELINLYEVIKADVDNLVEDLKKHRNESDYFYELREKDRDRKAYAAMSPVECASRMLFLNKTCYNGLFRVNRAGEFNSPFGNYKKPNIVNEDTLRAVSRYFNQADIRFLSVDFEKALEDVPKGAFVYLDPPYDPLSDTASFTGYDKGGFNRDEQLRLKRVCDGLTARGVHFLLSNSATSFTMELYGNTKGYYLDVVRAKRAINSNPEKRGEIDEILVRNYKLDT